MKISTKEFHESLPAFLLPIGQATNYLYIYFVYMVQFRSRFLCAYMFRDDFLVYIHYVYFFVFCLVWLVAARFSFFFLSCGSVVSNLFFVFFFFAWCSLFVLMGGEGVYSSCVMHSSRSRMTMRPCGILTML